MDPVAARAPPASTANFGASSEDKLDMDAKNVSAMSLNNKSSTGNVSDHLHQPQPHVKTT